jgi:GNAT superfamily N-acetyltransferase
VRIERFDAEGDEASRRALYDVYADGAPVDDPACPAMSPAVFTGWLVHGWTAQPRETWLATDGNGPEGGAADGGYRLELPHRENQHQGILVIWVRPARRRAGLGTALLRHAAGRALGHGRSVLTAETREGSAGDAFARSAGATPELTGIRRLLDVAAIPPGHLAGLRAAAQGAAAGYSVLIWDGPTPGGLVDQVAALNEAMADAPRGPGEQPEAWDAARVRGADERVAAQGLRYYSAAARHDATGELAGLTQLGVDPAEPGWGHQELTAVARGHRGHRLGLLVKVAMLEHLAEREPQLQWVTTWNGESNRHMIAVNETIGYRILDRWTTAWRLPVPI